MLTERGKTKKQRPLSPKYCISVVSPEKNNPYVFVYKELNYRELIGSHGCGVEVPRSSVGKLETQES